MRCLRFVIPLLVLFAAHNARADSVTEESFDAAARNYRIHVYETYRTNRGEYNRRMEQARALASVWHKLEDPSQKQAAFAWFADAKKAQGPPALPKFVANDALVIRKVTPKVKTEKLTVQSRRPQSQSQPVLPHAVTSRTDTKNNQGDDKPGFFRALTTALISKPKHEVGETEVASHATSSSDKGPKDERSESPSGPAMTTAASELVAAEVDEATEFEPDQGFGPDQYLELGSEIFRFNVDCDAVYDQLQDEAALDLDSFTRAVTELEGLSVQFVSIQQRLEEIPADQRNDIPDPQPTESMVHLAVERTQSPETWLNEGTVSDKDKQDLSALAGRLENLLQG